MVSFLNACATNSKAALEAAADQGKLEASRILPPLPSDCKRRENSQVKEGERLDVAVIKSDHAITRQNARIARCAKWYNKLKKGLEAPKA